jgi:hypothetical protein
MTGGKIGGILLVLIILGTIGYFGVHFGVGVSGTTSLERPQGIGILFSTIDFLWDAGTFQVEDIPVFLSAFIDILMVVFLVLILSMFLPTIAG